MYSWAWSLCQAPSPVAASPQWPVFSTATPGEVPGADHKLPQELLTPASPTACMCPAGQALSQDFPPTRTLFLFPSQDQGALLRLQPPGHPLVLTAAALVSFSILWGELRHGRACSAGPCQTRLHWPQTQQGWTPTQDQSSGVGRRAMEQIMSQSDLEMHQARSSALPRGTEGPLVQEPHGPHLTPQGGRPARPREEAADCWVRVLLWLPHCLWGWNGGSQKGAGLQPLEDRVLGSQR